MSDIRVNALVLKAIDYSEKDKLLTLLTLERGKLTARIRGCKSPKSKLRFAASPLSYNEYVLVKRADRYTVTGSSQKENFYEISDDINKFYSASLILELANRLTVDNQECREIFIDVLKLLNLLSYHNVRPEIIAIRAMTALMKAAGYAIVINECAICGSEDIGYFSCLSGGTVCVKDARAGDIRLRADLIQLLKSVINFKDEELGNIDAEMPLVKETLNLLNIFYTYQTDTVLKSVPELISFL